MTNILTTAAQVDSDTDEQAQRAVAAFRKLQPTLSAYARALTGRKDIRVELAANDNGSTDGSRIFYRPPIALGDKTSHDRFLCNRRDEVTSELICPACAVREEVLVTIYHEIGHNAFGTFDRVNDADKQRALDWAIKESKGEYRERIEKRIESAPEYVKNSYIGLAGLINEFLPTLVNSLEDARVDRAMFKAKVGLKRMFEVQYKEVFTNGFQSRNETGELVTIKWNETPLNSQIIIGAFVVASGYTDYQEWFHPKVSEALADTELQSIIAGMDSIFSASGVYNLSFKVLKRFRELGFCGTPQDPDPEPEVQDDSEDDSEDSPQDQGDPSASEATPPPVREEQSSDEHGTGGVSDKSEPESESSDQTDSPPETSRGERDSSEADELQEGTSDDGQQSEGSSSLDESSDENSDVSDFDSSEETGGDQQGPRSESPEDNSDDGDSNFNTEESDNSDQDSDGDSSEGMAGNSGDFTDSDPGGESSESSGDLAGGDGDGSGVSLEMDSESSTESDRSREDDAPEGDSGDGLPDAETNDRDSEDETDLVDTGADDGYGGTKLEEQQEQSGPPMGSADEAAEVFKVFDQHEEKPKSAHEIEASKKEDAAVERAIIQGIYFTSPSTRVWGVREHIYGQPYIVEGYNFSFAWEDSRRLSNVEISQTVLGPSVMRLRRAFSDNQRGSRQANLRSGRVNNRVLGSRAWDNDPRLFRKDRLPGKKDYHIVIGMDISGSTKGVNVELEKRAVFAQAEMLNRVGVCFEIWAHTGDYNDPTGKTSGYNLDMYCIKAANEPWNEKTQERLLRIKACSINLDGHALEFLRKKADASRATDKVILYYSDGKFPAANEQEELEVFLSEMRVCNTKGYTLLGVGIRTDSPRRHGLDTVEVHGDDDLIKVVNHLGKRLKD